MSTLSITKEFVVKDRDSFEKLKRDLAEWEPRERVVESSALQKGTEKLATFMFR